MVMSRFSDKTSKLCSAILKGDSNAVKDALCDGANVNTCMPYGIWGTEYQSVPVLTVVAYEGYDELATTLLLANADTEHRGDFVATPLIVATAMGHGNIAKALLSHGADVNAKHSTWGDSPIHAAAYNNRLEIAKILHSHGCSLEQVNNDGWTPLHYAAGCGHEAIAKWLVEQCVDITLVNNEGKTAADDAATCGHKKLAAWLNSVPKPVAAPTATPNTKTGAHSYSPAQELDGAKKKIQQLENELKEQEQLADILLKKNSKLQKKNELEEINNSKLLGEFNDLKGIIELERKEKDSLLLTNSDLQSKLTVEENQNKKLLKYVSELEHRLKLERMKTVKEPVMERSHYLEELKEELEELQKHDKKEYIFRDQKK